MLDTKSKYHTIRTQAIKLGVHDKVDSYAKKLQRELSEGSHKVPIEDAYEMAWEEIVIPKFY